MLNANNEFYQNSTINARKDNDEWRNADGTCSPNLIEKSITENGDYSAKADGADGYSSVTVDVSGGGTGTPILVEPASLAETINSKSNTVIASPLNDGGVVAIVDNFNNSYIVYPSPIIRNIIIPFPKTGSNTNTKHLLFKYGGNGITIQYYKTASGTAQDLKDTNNVTIAEQLTSGKVYLLDITYTFDYGSLQSVVGALTELSEDTISFTVE